MKFFFVVKIDKFHSIWVKFINKPTSTDMSHPTKVVTLKLSKESLQKFPEVNTISERESAASSAAEPTTPGKQAKGKPQPRSSRKPAPKSVDSPLKIESTSDNSVSVAARNQPEISANTMSQLSKTVLTANAAASSATGGSSGSSTSAATNPNRLDKSGAPVRKWIKTPVVIESFTGFNVNFTTWASGQVQNLTRTTKDEEKAGTAPAVKIEVKTEISTPAETPTETPTPADSRDQSPATDELDLSQTVTPAAATPSLAAATD